MKNLTCPRLWAVLVLLVLIGFPLEAETKKVAIVGARLIDGVNDQARADLAVVIEGERIVAVGGRDIIPADATVIDLGTIEPGKLADIVAVAGNPLEDISELERVIFVMKGGEIVKAP